MFNNIFTPNRRYLENFDKRMINAGRVSRMKKVKKSRDERLIDRDESPIPPKKSKCQPKVHRQR